MFGLFSTDSKQSTERRNRELREKIRDLERDLRIVEGKITGVRYSYKECLRQIELEKRTKDPDWRYAVDHYESQRVEFVRKLKYLEDKKERLEREIDELKRELGGGWW